MEILLKPRLLNYLSSRRRPAAAKRTAATASGRRTVTAAAPGRAAALKRGITAALTGAVIVVVILTTGLRRRRPWYTLLPLTVHARTVSVEIIVASVAWLHLLTAIIHVVITSSNTYISITAYNPCVAVIIQDNSFAGIKVVCLKASPVIIRYAATSVLRCYYSSVPIRMC